MKFSAAISLLSLFAAPISARLGRDDANIYSSPNEGTGDYIVKLKKPQNKNFAKGLLDNTNANNSKAKARQKGQFKTLMNGGFVFTLDGADEMTPEEKQKALADIAKSPHVESIYEDEKVHATRSTSYWGLDRIDDRARNEDGASTYEPFAPVGCDASSVKVYVLDTGIRTTHDEFGGRATYGYNFVDDNSDASDCDGHGTHVAGTIGGATTGVASNANLISLKVLGCDGSGSWSWAFRAIDWAIDDCNGGDCVINMSLGSGFYKSANNAVDDGFDAGITMVIAAGNSNKDACRESPGSAPGAFNVGSTTSSDTRSSWSNYGSCVDIFAPGSSIRSSSYRSDTRYTTKSGTSMAAPHVAGAAACYLGANPGASPSQVESALTSMATNDVISSAGKNSPNKLLYVGASTSSPPSTTTAAPPFTTTDTPVATTTAAPPSTTTDAPVGPCQCSDYNGLGGGSCNGECGGSCSWIGSKGLCAANCSTAGCSSYGSASSCNNVACCKWKNNGSCVRA